ncbi:MAG: mechanosensitive ion channel family protein [Gammaproteobacteria bacterium]|nr:mechanosensitive ion channel family protein [Gammaproteobacteria bacterium]
MIQNTSSTSIYASQWLVSGSLAFLFVSVLIMIGIKKYGHLQNQHILLYKWISFFIEVTLYPVILLVFSYSILSIIGALNNYLPSLFGNYLTHIKSVLTFIVRIIEFIAFFWIVLNVLNKGQLRIQSWLINTHKKVLSILLPMIGKSLKAAVILIMINMIIPEFGLTGFTDEFLGKAARVALIGIITWLMVEMINGLEKLILNQYSADVNSPTARKIKTQVYILKKVIFTLLTVVTIASILMVFDSVKALGAGLLTTAGLISAIGAFASQQSLGRIFAGLQLAFSQPIRIGDTIIVDKELGQVEEISLSYIIIKLWDLRRLVLPSDYFNSRPLENLTRSSTELLGTVFIYADYTLPVDVVRDKFNELLEQSIYWNKKIKGFQVTDVKVSAIEIRGLMSAVDSATLWNLRCEMREKLIKFIAETYPDCLSKSRSLSTRESTKES